MSRGTSPDGDALVLAEFDDPMGLESSMPARPSCFRNQALPRNEPNPEMWNIGNTASRTVGAPSGAPPARSIDLAPMNADSWTKPNTQRCERTAAFGRPDVPLVNKRTAGSSSSTSALSALASSELRRDLELPDKVVVQNNLAAPADGQELLASRVDHDECRVSQFQGGAELLGGPPAVERHDDRSHHHGTRGGEDPAWTVLRTDADAVALRHSEFALQHIRCGQHLLVELGKRDTRTTLKHQELGIAENPGSIQQLSKAPVTSREDLHRLTQDFFLPQLERTAGLEQSVRRRAQLADQVNNCWTGVSREPRHGLPSPTSSSPVTASRRSAAISNTLSLGMGANSPSASMVTSPPWLSRPSE